MQYGLTPAENLPSGFRRIAKEQFENVLSMARSADDPDLSVHGVRKTCKRMRGLLRLIRRSLSKPDWRFANIAFRDLSRLLRHHREGTVRLRTLAALGGPETVVHTAAEVAAREHQLTVIADLDEAARSLDVLEARVRSWPYECIDLPVVERGFRRVAKTGREALGAVERELNSEHLHEWRKHVKYLWYATRLWVGHRPDLEALRLDLERLSDLLGTEHDYADLRAYAAALSDPSTKPLEAVVRDHQSTLRTQILELGRPLFLTTLA